MSSRKLTYEEKERIYAVIAANESDDDKAPSEIIKETYGGDEDKYLRSMAKWFNIPLGD